MVQKNSGSKDRVDEFGYLENDEKALNLYLTEQQNKTQEFLGTASGLRNRLVEDIKRRLSRSSPVQDLVGAGSFLYFRMNDPNQPSMVLARSSLERPSEIKF